MQIGVEFSVDVVDQVVAGEGGIVVKITVWGFRRGPGRPAVVVINDEAVGLAEQFGLHRPLLLQIIQIFQEQHPGGLLSVVQLRGAARLFPEYIVDILEGLFEHG